MLNSFKIFFIPFNLLLLLISLNVHAHAPRENYVWINIEQDYISGRFEVNTNDLKNKLSVDIEQGSSAHEVQIEKWAPQVQKYLAENFSLSDTEGEIAYSFTTTGVSAEAEEFAQYHFRTQRLPASDSITIHNTIFLTPEYSKNDRLHRSLIVVEYNKLAGKDFGSETPFLVFSPSKSMATLDTVNPTNILQWRDFLVQGVLHIWMGFDHVLFLLVLLLTTVLVVRKERWSPIENFKGAFLKTLKIITLFTIAHSITLSLAAFDLVSLNSALIETVIAVSIIVVALNNIFPVFNSHAWILVFIFGLFHGLGFASVMADLQFRTVMLSHILVMFNIGVEIGQLVIVAFVFPLLFMLRQNDFYKKAVVIPVSVFAIFFATYWVMARTGLINNVA